METAQSERWIAKKKKELMCNMCDVGMHIFNTVAYSKNDFYSQIIWKYEIGVIVKVYYDY